MKVKELILLLTLLTERHGNVDVRVLGKGLLTEEPHYEPPLSGGLGMPDVPEAIWIGDKEFKWN